MEIACKRRYHTLSPQLFRVCGGRTAAFRDMVLEYLWEYIRDHGLQDMPATTTHSAGRVEVAVWMWRKCLWPGRVDSLEGVCAQCEGDVLEFVDRVEHVASLP